MKKTRLGLCLVVILFTASAGCGEPVVILDETAYWRLWLQGGPVPIHYEALKTEGEKLLGKRQLDRYRQPFE